MFITINGQLGSGKSEICKTLKDEYGFEIFHTGKIQRQYAQELGISTLELNELCKKDHSYDNVIDTKLVEYAEKERGNKVVFDSRMAWHFVKDTFKVHLLVSPDVAANRVFFNRVDKAEAYSSREEAMKGLIDRRRVEGERYEMLYHVKMLKYSNYDLVLDTTLSGVSDEVDLILECAKNYFENGKKAVYLSPVNVYPTGMEIGDGVKVVKYQESMYVVSGHDQVKKAISEGKALMEVELVGEDDDLVNGVLLKDLLNVNLDKLTEWEEENGMSYGFIPEYIINNKK